MAEEQGIIQPELNEQGQQVVQIREEEQETGGHFISESVVMDVAADSGWQTKDVSFPIPISILCAKLQPKASMDGDEVELLVGPETAIGAIAADVAVDDIIITVDATSMANGKIGHPLELTDGANLDNMGRVLSRDEENSKLTMENAAAHAFAVTTPTYVRMNRRMAKILSLETGQDLTIGSSRIGGAYVPANTIIRIRYNNISATSKKFKFILEYLY